jgi:predicted acylesterase/phospholipase RssA
MSYGTLTEYGVEVELEQSQSVQRGPKLFKDRRVNTLPKRREKLPWPKDRPFKILSLDGGGIRGLYGATLLARIEQELTHGEPISNYFDMVSGTSTGGIMALALGLQIPAERIERLYREDGGRIFPQKRSWKYAPWLKKLRHIFGALYDHDVLEKLLYREFGDKTLGDAVTRLAVPAFITPKTEIAVFKTDHHPDFKNDWRSKAWEVARATSAAPTYLNGHEYDDVIFLDGGVWANNPVMVAIVDVLSAYDVSREQIEVLSIGTGNFPFSITLSSARKGLWRWKEVIKGAMFLTTDNAHAQACLLLGPDKVLRLEPGPDANNIELDDWVAATARLPNMANNHFEENKSLIEHFFASKVLPRDRFYT